MAEFINYAKRKMSILIVQKGCEAPLGLFYYTHELSVFCKSTLVRATFEPRWNPKETRENLPANVCFSFCFLLNYSLETSASRRFFPPTPLRKLELSTHGNNIPGNILAGALCFSIFFKMILKKKEFSRGHQRNRSIQLCQALA